MVGDRPELLTEGEALCLLRSWGLTAEGAWQVLRKRARRHDGGNGLSDCYTAAEVARVAEPYRVAPTLAAEADTERGARIEAERVTLEFGSKSARRLDSGRRPITESPLFGGEPQESLW